MLVASALFVATVHAEPLPPVVPHVCVGFSANADGGSWGERMRGCAPNEGVFGTKANGGSTGRPGSEIAIVSTCCPLPSTDILTGNEFQTVELCPEGAVATGGDGTPVGEEGEIDVTGEHTISCRGINEARYQLGTPRPGIYWGFGSTYWQQTDWTLKRDIPAGFRWALGRIDKYSWLSHGCVGFPFGSLLVGKRGKSCSQKIFRQLLYKGAPGDPPAGTPVEMFPRCETLPDIYSETATCAVSVNSGAVGSREP